MLRSLVDANGKEYVRALAAGGAGSDERAMALALNETRVPGIREALLAARAGGYIRGVVFLRAIQEFTSSPSYTETLPLRAFEREVAKLANDPSDPDVQREAQAMLKFFTPCPSEAKKCPPVESLRLKTRSGGGR